MFKSIAQKEKETYSALKEKFGYKNPMQAPRLIKVIVSSGVGSISDKRKIELIPEKLALITGQKPSKQLAKKSIATFKVREGDLSGFKITLRGDRMREFLDKLINIALPRTKDFRGLSKKSLDEMGNFTIGIRENSIFPETSDQDIKDVFGFAITVVISSKKKEDNLAFLEYLGFPLKKIEDARELKGRKASKRK